MDRLRNTLGQLHRQRALRAEQRNITHVVGLHRHGRMSCHMVRFGAHTCNGIDSDFTGGDVVRRGNSFAIGIVRIGSPGDPVVSRCQNVLPHGNRIARHCPHLTTRPYP